MTITSLSHISRRPASLLRITAAALVLWAISSSPPRAQQSVLVPTGAVWKYLDTGADQGTAWRARSFDDAGWKSGAAELGYGDSDEATLVGYGPNSSAKYTTTYFRRAFSVSDPSAYGGLTLRVLRDDGAVVYLNGTEVFRTNMPAGTVTASTFASTVVLDANERTYVTAPVNPALLVNGNERAGRRDSPGRSDQQRHQLQSGAGGLDIRGRHARAVPAARHAARAPSSAGARAPRSWGVCSTGRAPGRTTSDAARPARHDRARGRLYRSPARHDVLLLGGHRHDACSPAATRALLRHPADCGHVQSRRASGCSATRARRTRTCRPCATRTTPLRARGTPTCG